MIALTLLTGCADSAGPPTTATVTTTSAATSSQQQRLPYGSEENAFMGSYGWKGDADISTGCLALQDSQVACDCTYRTLRSGGYPAPQLAAIGSEIAIMNNLPTNTPAWLARAEVVCDTETQ